VNNFDSLPEELVVGVGPVGVVITDKDRVISI
jgi:hypothetical protein